MNGNNFGKEMSRPKNVMERVKTFEDALKELGDNHPFVEHFCFMELNAGTLGDCRDIIAYLKLRIITAALNEGWTPQFTKDEYRYYPCFWLYTNGEIAKMNKEERKKCVLLGGYATRGAYAGLASAFALLTPSSMDASVGSRLCFKSDALAKYAGEQFLAIYVDFMGKRSTT